MNNPQQPIQSSISADSMTTQNTHFKSAGFFRRMAAIIYDGILVFSLLFFTSIPLIILFEKLTGESLYQHVAYYGFVLWLYAVAFIYFGWFWTHSGQTPGMKAWHLKITTMEGAKIGWVAAFKRYVGALLSWAIVGLGFLWVFISKSKKTWHGVLSHTRVFEDRN